MINTHIVIGKNMSKFGDLLGGTAPVTPAPVVPAPVVEAAPPAPVVIDETPVPPAVEKPAPVAAPLLKQELFKKSKDELEEIGRTVGIELDRRLSHSKLVVQLQAAIEKNNA